jgi:hypothetical protein
MERRKKNQKRVKETSDRIKELKRTVVKIEGETNIVRG